MAAPVRSNGKCFLILQILGDLRLGEEDHLPPRQWGSRGQQGLFPAPFVLTTGLAVHGKSVAINQHLVGSQRYQLNSGTRKKFLIPKVSDKWCAVPLESLYQGFLWRLLIRLSEASQQHGRATR